MSTYAGGRAEPGATTADTRRYIDFAARYGCLGVLVEGWNTGWDGDWFANGVDFNFTEPHPDFDLEQVAAHARSQGERLIRHHETSSNIAHCEKQLAAGLDLYLRADHALAVRVQPVSGVREPERTAPPLASGSIVNQQ